MRDYARARPELAQELGAQANVELARDVERHHRGRAEIRLEQIALHEAHAVAYAGPLRPAGALGHQPRIDLDADPARTEVAGRRDDDAAVARSQIVDDIVSTHAGELEHRLHDPEGRLDVGNVLAGHGRTA